MPHPANIDVGHGVSHRVLVDDEAQARLESSFVIGRGDSTNAAPFIYLTTNPNPGSNHDETRRRRPDDDPVKSNRQERDDIINKDNGGFGLGLGHGLGLGLELGRCSHSHSHHF